MAESFFSNSNKERIRKHPYRTEDIALADVLDYIEILHNQTRRHSHLGGVSPDDLKQPSYEA
ncbi:TPA: IS3 family transposase [Pseudomonas aeruginosa]|nr:IS3 family transposase [Pseudomonas aeruginosa]HCF6954655.1 IS3 family transposase [Pseudomonas aeruginosa]